MSLYFKNGLFRLVTLILILSLGLNFYWLEIAPLSLETKDLSNKNYDAAIILCHFNSPWGFSSRQITRMDKGIELIKQGTVKYLILTCGTGHFNPGTISFAQLSKEYILKRGIREDQLLLEDKSTNTYENIKFSLPIVLAKKFQSVLIVTSVDHMIRSEKIVQSIFPKNIKLGFVISERFSGGWSVFDFIWNDGGWVQYALFKLEHKL